MRAKIERTADGLKFTSSYSKGLINALKASIPFDMKRPVYSNGRFSHWLIDPSCENSLIGICHNFGITPPIQGAIVQPPTTQIKLLEVLYIGRPKMASVGENIARGLVGDEWEVLFPENVLKKWFMAGDNSSQDASTLYSILRVKRSATKGELKKAYRIASKRWHPDMNDEDTSEQFIKIKEAYDKLSNPLTRRKYDAALKLQASMTPQKLVTFDAFQMPVKCGLIMFEGKRVLGQWKVERIIGWEDIKNINGETLVTSYKKTTFGDYELIKEWI